jgi:hypothetical protein
MVPAHGDFDPLIDTGLSFHAVHQPMLAGDATGPPPGEFPLKGLWFPKALKRVPTGIPCKRIDPGKNSLVRL